MNDNSYKVKNSYIIFIILNLKVKQPNEILGLMMRSVDVTELEIKSELGGFLT